MRTVLIVTLALLVSLSSVTAGMAQTTRPQAPAPSPAPAPAPAPARPPVRRAAPPAPARLTLVITATDPRGATLPGVRVQVLGEVDRTGDTDNSGQVRFANMPAGTFRVRFSGDDIIPFEREVTLRAGAPAAITVALSEAPKKPAPPPPPPPAPAPAPAPPPSPTATIGPVGKPLALDVTEVLEKEFVGNRPRRESLLSCSGNTRVTMIQLNEPLPNRIYDSADAAYYVIGGEGSVRLADRDVPLVTNSYVSVPRGTAHSFSRKGRRALILIAVLSGAPCEEAR